MGWDGQKRVSSQGVFLLLLGLVWALTVDREGDGWMDRRMDNMGMNRRPPFSLLFKSRYGMARYGTTHLLWYVFLRFFPPGDWIWFYGRAGTGLLGLGLGYVWSGMGWDEVKG